MVLDGDPEEEQGLSLLAVLILVDELVVGGNVAGEAVGEGAVHVEGGDIVGGHYPYQEYHPCDARVEVKLSCLELDISRKNVVQNNILDKVVSVILFVVELLQVGQGDAEHGCIFVGCVIGALRKDEVFALGLAKTKGHVCVAVADKAIVGVA